MAEAAAKTGGVWMITLSYDFMRLRLRAKHQRVVAKAHILARRTNGFFEIEAYVQYLKTVIPFTSSVLEKVPLYPSKIRPLG